MDSHVCSYNGFNTQRAYKVSVACLQGAEETFNDSCFILVIGPGICMTLLFWAGFEHSNADACIVYIYIYGINMCVYMSAYGIYTGSICRIAVGF